MTLWKRATNGLKAFTMRFSGAASYGWSVLLGRTRYNYAKDVGDGTGSSIVIACVNWVARTFPEAPVQVSRVARDGTREVLRDNPMVQLLEQPNPFYSGALLWMATLLDWMVSGNAYWLKVRSSLGRPVQLWWVPQSLIEPRWPQDGTEFISHYEYRPDPGRAPERLEVADVVHFRWGLDPRNPRKGLSSLGTLLREIFTDDEAANFSASLLRNLGIPGVILSPDADDVHLEKDDANTIKSEYLSKFSGDGRGQPMVLSQRLKAQMLSFNPQQMDLKTLRRLPEERVTAVLGIPAIVAGLGAGLDRSTFANFREAREAAYESNIIPSQRLFAAELRTQLLVDFGDTRTLEVGFDLSRVRVLQEDQDALAQRLERLVKAGILKRSEARSALGQPVEKGDDVYLLPISVVEVGPDAPALPPALPAPRPQKRLTLFTESKAARTMRTIERQAQKAIQGYLDGQYEAAADALLEQGKAAKDAGDVAQLPLDDGAGVRRVMARYYPQAIQRAFTDADLVLDVVLDVGLAFDLDNPAVQEVLDELAEKVSRVADSTREEIRALVGRQAAEGWSIEQLAGEIRRLKEISSPVRAEMIARTESASAYSKGSLLAYQQSGVVWGTEWLTTQPCEICEELDGQQKALGELYNNGQGWRGEGPPVHPSCRCALAPVLEQP